MKHFILFALLLSSPFLSFGQTRLVVDRRDGKKDSIALNTISKIGFPAPVIYSPSLLEVVNVLDSACSKFILYANLTNGDVARSLELTEYWLLLQPYVKSAYIMDDSYITINLTSGIKTTFIFDEVDDNEFSVYRGGNEGNKINYSQELIAEIKEILSKNIIENKKVLLYEVAPDLDLEPQIKLTTDILVKSGLGLTVKVVKYQQCSADVVETFKDYGLVFIDTHGMIDAFLMGKGIDFTNIPQNEDSVKSAINKQLGSDAADKLKSGKTQLAASIKGNPRKSNWMKSLKRDQKYSSYWFTGKYIQSLPPMPNTIIFGNMCYSGWIIPSIFYPETTIVDFNLKSVTTPEHTENFENSVALSFIGRNPISYYGYSRNEYVYKGVKVARGTSRKVTDSFCKQMESAISLRLADKKDSTGLANLKSDNKTEYAELHASAGDLYFRHYGPDNYSYQNCGDTLRDERDGQKYTTVCIGKQNWMKQNLNYNAPGSIAYDNNSANGQIYGRLYDYKTIMQGASANNSVPSGVRGICPKGWHVPSSEEYLILFDAVGFDTAGGALKAKVLWDAPNTGATNSSGFTGLPGGFTGSMTAPGSSLNLGKMAYFATTTTENNTWTLWNLVYDSSEVQGTGGLPENWGVSCRCLKD